MRDFFRSLFVMMVKWLTTDPKGLVRNVFITPVYERLYTSDKLFLFKSKLYNHPSPSAIDVLVCRLYYLVYG